MLHWRSFDTRVFRWQKVGASRRQPYGSVPLGSASGRNCVAGDQQVTTMAQESPLRILLIDDDLVLLQTLSDALDLYGFQTFTAASGAEGLAQVVAQAPMCVVVDIRMPEINGYQFVRTLRGDPSTAAIPVVILSALAQEHEQLAGMLTGADAYLLKPVTIARLIEVITEMTSSGADVRMERRQRLLDASEERAQ